MKSGIAILSAAVLGMLSVAPSLAFASTAVSVKAGTLGAGLEADVRIPNSHFGIRAGLYGLGFGVGHVFEDNLSFRLNHQQQHVPVNYDADLRLLNGLVTADYYPFGTGFRLSAGLDVNANRLSATGTPTGSNQMNEFGTLQARAVTNAVAPYIGLGYAGAFNRHVVWSVDAGAFYQGNLRASVRSAGAAPVNAAVISEAVSSEEGTVNNKLHGYPVYPVVMMGIGYRF